MIVESKVPQNTGYAINPIERRVSKRDGSYEYEFLGWDINNDPDRVSFQEPVQVFTREQALSFAHSIIKAVA